MLERVLKIKGKELKLISNKKGIELYTDAEESKDGSKAVYVILGDDLMGELALTIEKSKIQIAVKDSE